MVTNTACASPPLADGDDAIAVCPEVSNRAQANHKQLADKTPWIPKAAS